MASPPDYSDPFFLAGKLEDLEEMTQDRDRWREMCRELVTALNKIGDRPHCAESSWDKCHLCDLALPKARALLEEMGVKP